jgi:UDP-N-acetylmuramate--alanine ligase
MSEHYHFIGIGGIGMSGIARILLERNAKVSGSDIVSSPITEQLKQMGGKIFHGQSPNHITPSMTVVFSTDIKECNPEFQAAVKLKCRMLHRSEMLLELMKGFKTLAITGTHGKTTTTSLLSWVLHKSGVDPSFCIGGMLPQFKSNAMHGKGAYFVAEADESDGTFLRYHPYGGIVTNIDLDHMNYYKTETYLVDSFKKFMDLVVRLDLLFWCGDDARLNALEHKGVDYGFSKKCQLQCSSYRQDGWTSYCNIAFEGKYYDDVELGLVGQHNILNAAAVFGLALRLGMPEGKIRNALKTFGGVARRCEKKGEFKSILFLDDYAHHPTEIHTTLKGIKAAFPKRRLIAVFQPHRYSRTKDCIGMYGPIFNDADHLIVTDIYSAGEAQIPGLSAQNVLQEVQAFSKISCCYVPRENLAMEIVKTASCHDVVITLGAGSITKVSHETLELLQRQ